jgi:hypothetical protein
MTLLQRTRMTARLGLAVPVLGGALVSGGCRGEGAPSSPDLVLDLAISPTPPMVGPAQFVASLQDTTGAPLQGATVVIRGDMTHAGMAPVMDTARAIGPGRYGIQAFVFTMAGDWILTVEASLPDGRHASITRSTTVVSPPPGQSPDSGRSGGGGSPGGGASSG